MRSKLWQGDTAQRLCKDYQDGAGIRELGRKYHVSHIMIHNTLINMGVSICPTGRRPRVKINKDELLELYWGKLLSAVEIAKLFGCHEGNIRGLMRKYDISRRSASEKQLLRYKNKPDEGRIHPNLEITENMAYILGVMEGDGYAYRNHSNYIIGLGVTSEKFAKSFFDALKKIGLNPHMGYKNVKKYNPNAKDQFSVTSNSKRFYSWHKQLSIQQIQNILERNQKYMRAFVRGFYESEGTLSMGKYWRTKIYNSNEERISLAGKAIKSLGFNYAIRSHQRPNRKCEYVLEILGGTDQVKHFIHTIKPCIKDGGG